MKIDIEKIKNMTIEEMKKMVNKNINQEEFKALKKELIKSSNIKNDILDLVTKYGVDNTPEMVDFLIDEMKIYFKLINNFNSNNFQESKKCCCERDELNVK